MPWARNRRRRSSSLRASKTSMNSLPMVLRLLSGSAMPASAPRKGLLGVHVDERDVVVAAEQAHDLLRLAEAQQAVIDEDAGQLLADRFVDQHGGDRGIDAAGQAADHAALADLLADCARSPLAEGAPSSSRRGGRRSCGRNCAAVSRRRACARPRDGTAWRRTCACSSAIAAKGAFGRDCRPSSKPGGARVTRSPWLIQTW